MNPWMLIAPLGFLSISLASAQDRALQFRAGTPTEARAAQSAAREKLFETMMGGAKPERVPLEPRVLRSLEVPELGCVLQELRFVSVPGRDVHAWLARPKKLSGKLPAILALHGHGGTGEQIVRGEGLYWYGREMARRGYIVISPDIGQHELQHTNWSLMGERTWDAIRCVDYLVSLPEVDPQRLAVAGLSLGGETTMYVGAVDERLGLVCSSGWLTTVANMRNGHCQCFDFPGLQENFDFSDIFACIAPRRLICELGRTETAPGGFPVAVGEPAFREILAAYKVFGAETNAVLDLQPGGHVFVGNAFWKEAARTLGTARKPGLRLEEWSLAPEVALTTPAHLAADDQAAFRLAVTNARLANEAFFRCRLFVEGWLGEADPASGLIPRNLRESRDFWNGRDSAADNYPFMVLTAAMTDPGLLQGRLLQMLHAETRLTSRVGRLPDDYSFSKKGWRRDKLDLDALIFDGAEYVKDGLLPITEWLGPSPWSERMLGIVDDIWERAAIDTPFGRLPTLNVEVSGDLLQACSRLFWFTSDRKYLDWAVRLGDYYLLGTNHPTRDLRQLRLLDHGCEVVNGLAELYLALSKVDPAKKSQYTAPITEMFDCILEKGRNADGLLYAWFNPQTGEHSPELCDTWGYDYDGVYAMWLVDGKPAYREAVRKVLGNLKGKYVGACWIEKSADAYADSIEGALNLLNREFIPDAADWLDSQTALMWGAQRTDGIIEGWHGDGNFARTSLMYALWKTQGATIEPWRSDVQFGAVKSGNALHLVLSSRAPWKGKLKFDRPRHRELMKLPLDYPRINQFPEWFTVEAEGNYGLSGLGAQGLQKTGTELTRGVELETDSTAPAWITVVRQE